MPVAVIKHMGTDVNQLRQQVLDAKGWVLDDEEEDEDEEEEWTVKSVKNRRVVDGQVQYLVEWEQGPPCTWQPEEDLDHAKETVETYLARRQRKRQRGPEAEPHDLEEEHRDLEGQQDPVLALTQAMFTCVQQNNEFQKTAGEMLQALQGKAVSVSSKGDAEEELSDDEDDSYTLTKDKPCLKGKQRLQKLQDLLGDGAFAYFQKERNLDDAYYVKMKRNQEPFAYEYNEALMALKEAEQQWMEQQLLVAKASAAAAQDAGKEAKLHKYQEAKAMEQLLEKQWMVCDDKVVFI